MLNTDCAERRLVSMLREDEPFIDVFGVPLILESEFDGVGDLT